MQCPPPWRSVRGAFGQDGKKEKICVKYYQLYRKMAVYTFINAWNMYMWPLLVTGSDSKRTVQIGISMLNSVDAQSITLMLAGVVMIIIPSISIFIVGQKALIKGMFSGAVKG